MRIFVLETRKRSFIELDVRDPEVSIKLHCHLYSFLLKGLYVVHSLRLSRVKRIVGLGPKT